MGKSRIILFLIILAYALSGEINAQETKVFSVAEGSRAAADKGYYTESWSFLIGQNKYEINKTGRGKRIDGNKTVRNFRISIEGGSWIDEISFSEYENDLLLIEQVDFGDGAGGFILRLDGQTLKTKWQASIPAFNIAPGLIEKRAAYLAGIGFIAKINLATGKYIWRHDNLYRKYDESGAFNVFETPLIDGGKIIFKEKDVSNRGFDHQIHVDKSTGKIIKVILN